MKPSCGRKLSAVLAVALVAFVAVLLLPLPRASASGDWGWSVAQISTNLLNDLYPSIADGRVAWIGADGHDDELFLYDISTKSETRLTTNEYDDLGPYPNMAGNLLTSYRSDGQDTEIFLRDLSTGVVTQLTSNTVDDIYPNTDGRYVVWDTMVSGTRDVMLFDTATGEYRRVTNNGFFDQYPVVKDGTVAWYGERGAGWEIFVYDIATGVTTRVTTNTTTDYDHWLGGGKVVWLGHPSGDSGPSDVYSYDLATRATARLTSSTADESYPRIEGSHVIWEAASPSSGADHDIILYDLATRVATTIGTPGHSDHFPRIQGDLVTYYGWDGQDYEIYLYDISTAALSQMTDNTVDDYDPVTDGEHIAWWAAGTGRYDVFLATRWYAPEVSVLGGASEEGQAYAAAGSFSDQDSSSWTATVDYGDGTGWQPLTLLADKSFQLYHTYADNGAYQVVVTVTDDGGASGAGSATVTVANVAPVASPVAAQSLDEGETLHLEDVPFNDPGVLDTHTATVDWGDGTTSAALVSESGGSGTLSAFHTYPDNGSFAVTITITDKDGGTGERAMPLLVANLPPRISLVSAPLDPLPLGPDVGVRADYADPGILDTHTAVWDWDDGTSSAGLITETNGSGSAIASHAYAQAGIYQVRVTVTDKDGGSDTESFSQYVVVYDPSSGFVTGGGWITSPMGAFVADPSLTGKASFGFVSKYQKGAKTPSGQTEFQFQLGNLNFHSTDFDWLVIAGAKARYKGAGTINGEGDYVFLLSAIDGQAPGGGGVDRFRIKIWDKGTGTIVYDNQLGAADDAAPTTAIQGGSVVIHR